jgi:hypothetical protein
VGGASQLCEMVVEWVLGVVRKKFEQGGHLENWQKRDRLEECLSGEDGVSEACKRAVPLNVMGTYYFLERLGELKVEERHF